MPTVGLTTMSYCSNTHVTMYVYYYMIE